MSHPTGAITTLARAHLVVLLVLGLLAGAGQAPAQTPDDADLSWGVRTVDNEHGQGRANYAYVAGPGEQLTDGIVVSNRGTDVVSLDITTADGYTTPEGRLAMYPADVPATGVGAWTQPETDTLTLNPGQSREVTFTLTVPPGASPGDHTGGIFAVFSSADGANLQFDRRIGLRIHLRVPGEVNPVLQVDSVALEHTTSLNPFAAGRATLTYSVTNTGNVRTYFHEHVVASGPSGLAQRRHQDTAEEILPGSAVERTVVLPGTWALGRTTATLEVLPVAVSGEAGPPVTADLTVTAIPWSALALLVLILATAVLLGVVRFRRAPAREDERTTISA